MKKVYVIYWANSYKEFKGELYCTKYNTHIEVENSLYLASLEAEKRLIEIKEMYYIE